MSTKPSTPIPPLLRPPSYQQTAVEWAPGGQPRFVVINPMHIISLQDKTKTFAVRLVEKIKAISEKWFTHVLLLLFLIIFASLGALLFQWLEEEKEDQEKTSVERTRNITIEQLWNLVKNNTPTEQEWWALAHRDLVAYESQIEVLLRSKTVTNSETRVWSFWGALFYCGTVFTTIGYGNIYPATTAGQAATIVYAFFGIPFLLMVLADLGKLFTRWIKALFYYVRLFYHTGKFRKARRMGRRATAVPVQYMSVALNKMPYVMSPSRSRKAVSADDPKQRDLESGNGSIKIADDDKENKDGTEDGSDVLSQNHVDSDNAVGEKAKKNKKDKKTEEEEEEESAVAPVSPDEIDDEFNLPVSLAVIVLVTYMTVGAAVFTIWEEWTFFESFYFVFISMSTIGFGDYVPDHPMFMMATFIYLLFGLALTSMCINIVQEKLSATFEMAKLRIGTTIGLDANIFMTEEVSPDEGDSPEKSKGSLKSRRGSKVPPGKSPEGDAQSEQEGKNLKSDGSETAGSPEQVKNGTIKKRPATLSVEPTQYE